MTSNGATSSGAGLRGLARASVRDHVATQALRLFDEKGFDATTVDDIAEAIGMSSRSFFRYFPAKEDVVLGRPMTFGEAVRDAAAGRPPDEPIWDVLRHAFAPVEENSMTETAQSLRAMRVLMSTASLRARNLEKHIAWASILEPVVIARLDGPEATKAFRAQTLIHAALACLDVASREWTHLEGKTALTELLDDAFNLFRL